MSNLSEILDEVTASVGSQFRGCDFNIYTLRINGTDVDYNSHFSDMRFDSDGDIFIDLTIDKDDIIKNHLEDEDLICYLESIGYEVKEGE